MRQPQSFLRTGTLGALAAGLVAMAATSPAAAKPRFDGQWSVVIITERGDCDRSYRYPVRIERGALVNAGSVPVNISGKVGGNGTVTVHLSYGEKSARGSGKLGENHGSGSWSGGACAGSWSAERRESSSD